VLFCESAKVEHISIRSWVHGPSSGSLAAAADVRDAVEARELKEGAEDLVDAVEGRVDLADVRPGIVGADWGIVLCNDRIRLAHSWLGSKFGSRHCWRISNQSRSQSVIILITSCNCLSITRGGDAHLETSRSGRVNKAIHLSLSLDRA
jgi:hypothetical protein